jgi:tellurite methyltransferase
MHADASIRFFEAQFRRQAGDTERQLNPFEVRVLPHLRGQVLDLGCGLGNLALAGARRGCEVLAIDASHTAIEYLRQVAQAEALPLRALEADLRTYELRADFDAIVSIGLLMFFDCPTAFAQLRSLQDHVRPGGVAAVNVLVEGTTYLEMFDPGCHCLFARGDLAERFAGWDILGDACEDFPAPNATVKSFATVIARKPGGDARKADPQPPALSASLSGPPRSNTTRQTPGAS